MEGKDLFLTDDNHDSNTYKALNYVSDSMHIALLYVSVSLECIN